MSLQPIRPDVDGIPESMSNAMDYPGLARAVDKAFADASGGYVTYEDSPDDQPWYEYAYQVVYGKGGRKPMGERLEQLGEIVDIKLRNPLTRSDRGHRAAGGPVAERSEGVQPNNMDPPFSHWRNEGSKPYLSALLELPQGGGGIDWLQATGYGYCLGHLFDKLTKVKEHLHQNGETWGVVQLDPGDTKSIAMIADASDGKGFSRQPFIIKWEEIVVAFGATKESNGTRPICTLRITGSPLLKFGEGGVLKRAARLLKWLGIEAEFKPSRIDFCVDLPGVKVSEFVDAWKEGSGVVSKCKDMQLIYNGQEPSGMISKSNRVRMTVYDKRLEVLTRSPDKLNDMMEKRWGGLPDHATRVEFQVYLSKFDAERKPQSLEDCIGHSWRLFSWLSLKWFRLTTGEVDRTHTTRAPIHPVWRLTFKAAELVFARLNTKLPDTIPREVSDEALRAQWFGLTAAFMARMECANPIEFLREVAPALVLEPFLTKLEKQFGKRGISLREVYGESEGVPIDNNGSW